MATIFLTGASGGLGHVVKQTLLNLGHRVVATVHSVADTHPPAADSPGELFSYQVDLTDAIAVDALVQQVITDHGPIDAAVLLAGGFAPGSLLETDAALIDNMLTMNFKTAYNAIQPIFAHMTQQTGGGRFVLIGARPALDVQVGKHLVAYALSKSLLFQLSDIINATGKSNSIVSTVIVPSTIDTSTNRQALPEADFTTWVDPQDLADMITFVLFDKGRILREPVLKVYNRA